MNLRHVLLKLLTTRPDRTARIGWRLAHQTANALWLRRRDDWLPTFGQPIADHNSSLATFLQPIPRALLREREPLIRGLADHILAHRFNLLGSGLVQPHYGCDAKGCEGHRYEAELSLESQQEVNWANRQRSAQISSLLSGEYEPIDWQLDFKSGYRWDVKTWSREIRYGDRLGVDVKVPWELARMQHLPLLAYAHALEADGESESHYRNEFCDQIIDFVAHNPPRFGVHWETAMDVALRAANWLLAYDLFVAHGAAFSQSFRRCFVSALSDHAVHLTTHLEWNETGRGNHYLADLVGLLFVASYLKDHPLRLNWLSFVVPELLSELDRQFHIDGSNFEASTAYHGLSGEMAVYSSALLYRLGAEMPDLSSGQSNFRPGAIPNMPNEECERWLPHTWIAKLHAIGEFSSAMTHPNGQLVQWGDNDSGRFAKLDPRMDELATWTEQALDQSYLVRAAHALFDDSAKGADAIDSHVVRSLAGDPVPILNQDDGHRSALPHQRFDDFGAYVMHREDCYLAVRCGNLVEDAPTGHAHNDQLSFECSVAGHPVVIDPGTFLYTPLPRERNRLRSTRVHSTLALEDQEQIPIPPMELGLFHLHGEVNPKVIDFCEGRIELSHQGFGAEHRRILSVSVGSMEGVDICEQPGPRTIAFPLAPGVAAVLEQASIVLQIGASGSRVTLTSRQVTEEKADWEIEPSEHCPAYGISVPNLTCRLRSSEQRLDWRMDW